MWPLRSRIPAASESEPWSTSSRYAGGVSGPTTWKVRWKPPTVKVEKAPLTVAVTLQGVSAAGGGATATFRIAAPGGTWGAGDGGLYTIQVVAGSKPVIKLDIHVQPERELSVNGDADAGVVALRPRPGVRGGQGLAHEPRVLLGGQHHAGA